MSRGGAPEPLAFTAVGGETAAQLRDFYGLDGRFPWDQLLSAFRHTLSRRLYLTSGEGAAAVRTSGLRVLAAGVKVFEVDPSLGVGCPWRVVQEGALLLLPFLGRRLAAVQPNGCVVLACDNGRGTARAAVVAQKYTDKAVTFVSEGERKLLLDDLGAYF